MIRVMTEKSLNVLTTVIELCINNSSTTDWLMYTTGVSRKHQRDRCWIVGDRKRKPL